MTSHARGSTTLASMRPANSENDVIGAPRTKMDQVGRVTRTRAAMTDIGNKAGILGLKAGKAANKKDAVVKPARGLTKQKATSTLTSLPEARVTRRSAEKEQQLQQMEAEETQRNEDVEMEDVDSIVAAFSTKNLGPVDNIDEDDSENPQLVVEYVNEIYAYLRHLESVQNVKPDYLNKSTGTSILPKMRAVLVDWLIQVHQQFNLLQETLYLTVAILDRYLQVVAGSLERKQLQLVGVAAMFIAAKYEEMYAPEIGDFEYITDHAYSGSQIREMEMRIMDKLGFELGRPLPLHFLRRCSKAGNVDAFVHTLAKYAMELTLVDYAMVHVKPSVVAAASLAFAMKVHERDATRSIRDLWTPTLVHYTSYTFDQLSDTVGQVASIVLGATRAPTNGKVTAVRKKYEDKKFSRIAKMAELTGESVESMANRKF